MCFTNVQLLLLVLLMKKKSKAKKIKINIIKILKLDARTSCAMMPVNYYCMTISHVSYQNIHKYDFEILPFNVFKTNIITC